MRENIAIAGVLAVIALFFSVPHLILSRTVDTAREPIRHYEGDTGHYLAILHATVSDGVPRAQAYFWEEPEAPAQFLLFQSFLTLLYPFREVSIAFFETVFQVLVGIFVFFLLRLFLVAYGISRPVALVVSFCFVLLYGPIAFHGYALGNWFLPAFLAGWYCSARFFLEKDDRRACAWSFGAVLLFSVHPIYITAGGCALLLLWLFRLYHGSGREGVRWFLVWGLLSAALFLCLYGVFLQGNPAGDETLYRIVALDTRLPIHTLLGLRLLTLAALAFFLRETLIASFAFAGFVGVMSHVITGRYVVNDHYSILEDFLAPAFALAILFRPHAQVLDTRFRRSLVILFAIIAAFSVYDILVYLNFQPGYLGRYAPVLGGYVIAALLLVFPRAREPLRSLVSRRSVAVIFIAFSLVYGVAISKLDGRPYIPKHQAAQEYRPLINEIRKLPKGVVLANPYIENMIALYTPHKVYWSHIAFSETVSNDELKRRWLDTMLFFPGAEGLHPVFVTGNTDRCYIYIEYIEFLERVGFSYPRRELCDRVDAREALWPVLAQEARLFASTTALANKWEPVFRVDYLVVDSKNDAPPPWLIEGSFSKVAEIGDRFTVYLRKK